MEKWVWSVEEISLEEYFWRKSCVFSAIAEENAGLLLFISSLIFISPHAPLALNPNKYVRDSI